MKKPFNGDFPVTQAWGVNPQNYSQFGYKGHNGVDYGLPTGTPVVAPHGGKVIEAVWGDPSYGNYVKIEDTLEGSILAHLKSFSVGVGQNVSEGQQIGLSDTTGNATGPHLHWGFYRFPRNRQNGYGGTIDPTPYLQPPPPQLTDTERVKTIKEKVNTSLSDPDFRNWLRHFLGV